MEWFDDQIRERKDKDREIFEDSILEMASVVVGKHGANVLRDKFIVTKEVIDDILNIIISDLRRFPTQSKNRRSSLNTHCALTALCIGKSLCPETGIKTHSVR